MVVQAYSCELIGSNYDYSCSSLAGPDCYFGAGYYCSAPKIVVWPYTCETTVVAAQVNRAVPNTF